MSPAGFEPALPKETDLKSVALDHSAKETLLCVFVVMQYRGVKRRSSTELHLRRNDRIRTCDHRLEMQSLIAVTIL